MPNAQASTGYKYTLSFSYPDFIGTKLTAYLASIHIGLLIILSNTFF